MNLRAALDQLLATCSQLHALAQEENACLSVRHAPPPAELLERKRRLLTELAAGLDALREAAAAAPGPDRSLAALRDRAKARIEQLVALDRENEKLLLRLSMPLRAAPPASAEVGPGAVARLYGR